MIDINNDKELRDAIELLYLGYRSFTAKADRLLEKRGLNRAHHRILYFVGKNENGSVAELLESLAISKQALNTPLKQLVSMNLISNQRSPQDARVRQLKLTTSGKRLEAQLTQTQSKLLSDVFETTGKRSKGGWKNVMQVLADT